MRLYAPCPQCGATLDEGMIDRRGPSRPWNIACASCAKTFLLLPEGDSPIQFGGPPGGPPPPRTLEEAQREDNVWVVIYGDYGGGEILKVPARKVKCTEERLFELAIRLDEKLWMEPAGLIVMYDRRGPENPWHSKNEEGGYGEDLWVFPISPWLRIHRRKIRRILRAEGGMELLAKAKQPFLKRAMMGIGRAFVSGRRKAEGGSHDEDR